MRASHLSVTIALLLLSTSAFAQDTSRAQALFEEGRRLMKDGHYAEACPKLAASQRLDPGAGTLMNLATCYEKNNQLASAWAVFKEAASSSRASNHPDWETAARGRADALEPDLPRLTVVVPKEARADGLVVERDGSPLDPAEWGAPIPIDAGNHVITAKAPSRKPWSAQVAIAGPKSVASIFVGVLENADAPPAPTVGPRPAGGDADANDGKTQRLLGVIAGGAGVLALGGGAFFGLKASSTRDDALSNCNPQHQCTARGIELGEDSSSQATISTVFFIAGGVLLASGVVLYLTAPRSSSATLASSLRATGLGGTF